MRTPEQIDGLLSRLEKNIKYRKAYDGTLGTEQESMEVIREQAAEIERLDGMLKANEGRIKEIVSDVLVAENASLSQRVVELNETFYFIRKVLGVTEYCRLLGRADDARREYAQRKAAPCEHEWVTSLRPDIVKGSWCNTCGVIKP